MSPTLASRAPQPIPHADLLSQRSRWLREYGLSLAEQLCGSHPLLADRLLRHLDVLRRQIRHAIVTGDRVELQHLLDRLDQRLEPAEIALRDAATSPHTRHHAA